MMKYLFILVFFTFTFAVAVSSDQIIAEGDQSFDNKDYKTAYKKYNSFCNKKSIDGCNGLGFLYLEGKGVEKNYSKAMGLFKKVCNSSNKKALKACMNQAYMYEYELGFKKDYKKLNRIYKRGCKLGDSNSCLLTAKSYIKDNNPIKKNHMMALYYSIKTCELGNKEGCKVVNIVKQNSLLSHLTKKENLLFNHILKDEILSIIEGNENFLDKSYLKKEYINTTSKNIQSSYERNEVSADMKYQNKDIVLTSKIKRISKDMFNKMVLDLSGGKNQFMPPKAYIKDDYINWVSQLSINDTVKIYCNNPKMIVGSVILNNCTPLFAEIDNQTNLIISEINKNWFNEMNKNILKMGAMAIELNRFLKENSNCYKINDNKKCIKELEYIFKKKEFVDSLRF